MLEEIFQDAVFIARYLQDMHRGRKLRVLDYLVHLFLDGIKERGDKEHHSIKIKFLEPITQKLGLSAEDLAKLEGDGDEVQVLNAELIADLEHMCLNFE